MPAVEQVRANHAGIGMCAGDHDRAFLGFTLVAPQSGGGNQGTGARGSGAGPDILAGVDLFPAR